MKKINLSITGCMGRMGQQLIKSSKNNKNFKIVSLTESKIINKKIVGVKLGLNNIDSFKNTNVIIDFTVPKCTLEILKIASSLKKNVPSDVPGIAFLSGGQSEIEASKNLNEINKINDSNFLITFSYGRGLQASALNEFGKKQDNIKDIQKAFNHRAKMNGLSSKGEWSEDLEKVSAA